MSQAGILSVASAPAVPTDFVTDVNSPAIPAANILDVFGGSVTTNNAHGIQTDGSSGGNVLTVQLTNRLQGTITTVGAVTSNIISFPLGATPAGYVFQFNLIGFDTATPSATSWWFLCGARTTGVAGTSLGSSENVNEDGAMGASDVNIAVVGNTMNLEVVGVAGLTIDWSAVGYYVRST